MEYPIDNIPHTKEIGDKFLNTEYDAIIASILELIKNLGLVAGSFVPAVAPGSALPTGEGITEGKAMILQEGTYTQSSGNIVVEPNHVVIAVYDGTSWAAEADLFLDADLTSFVEKSSIKSNNFILPSSIEDGNVNSDGTYGSTVGAKRVRNLTGFVAGKTYILNNIAASSIKFFSFRNSSDANVGTVQNLGTIPFAFVFPSNASGVSFTIKAPGDSDSSYANATILESGSNEFITEINNTDIGAKYLTNDAEAPEPTTDKSPTPKKYVDDLAIPLVYGRITNSSFSTDATQWTWSINEGGDVTVNNVSGIWDFKKFVNETDVEFTVSHIRFWVMLGYSSPTNICALGITGSGNLFGQVVNVDITADTFTVVRAGSVPFAPIGTVVRVSVDGDNIYMYKNGVLSQTLSISNLVSLGANLSTINMGLSAANFSGVNNGDIIVSKLKSVSKEPISSIVPRVKYLSTNWLKGFVLGDSISTASYGGLVDGQIWWQLVRDRLGMEFSANAVSGTPIAEKSGFNSFVTDARWQAASLDVDVYIVEGGTNDFGARQVPLGVLGDTDKTTFYGALAYLFNGINTRYPKAKVFYMSPLHLNQSGYGFPETNATTEFKLQQYVDAARQMCDLYGVNMIDMYQKSGLTYQNMIASGSYSLDGLHPNSSGHIRMSDVVSNLISISFS